MFVENGYQDDFTGRLEHHETLNEWMLMKYDSDER